jgi:hypothetical protein
MNVNHLAAPVVLASSVQIGKIPIRHLKRYWSKAMLKRINQLNSDDVADEWQTDKTLLFTLGLGLEQTIKYLYQEAPDFDEFENWVIETAGMPATGDVERFNNLFTSNKEDSANVPQVLGVEELDFWDKNGYVIIKDAVSKEDCEKAIEIICNFIEVDRNDPSTWYNAHPARQGIMVQLFQDAVLEKNRQSVKIRQAYEQLWNRTDLWVTADRVGFNPPETEKWQFPGPHLHWDVSLSLPIPFGTQGILYLADTEANQGAFTLVPGFQHRVDDWINSLPPDVNPRRQDLHALGSMPVTANAGDFIIWHHALPHGSSPNTSAKPRFVHYINYEPAKIVAAEDWK